MYPETPHQDRHRCQLYQSTFLGSRYDGGLSKFTIPFLCFFVVFLLILFLQDTAKNGVLAVQTLRNNIMASTLLASTAIMLSSLIALLMTSANGEKSLWIVFGTRTQAFFSIKFFLILLCFLVAFLLNVQSIRYYSHASILINVPFKKISTNVYHLQRTADYVARTVNRGSYFWSLGLRAFYFSFPLFLWIFGPIPMFLSCLFLVVMLYFLDVTFELGWPVGVSDVETTTTDEELGA